MVRRAFADRNWSVRRAVIQIIRKKAKSRVATACVRNSPLTQVSVLSVLDCVIFLIIEEEPVAPCTAQSNKRNDNPGFYFHKAPSTTAKVKEYP